MRRSTFLMAVALAGVSLAVPGLARHELTIGNSNIVVKTVTGELDAEKRQLQLNDDVYFNETIATLDESATEITFIDGTTLTLGQNTQVILDRFIYDPDPSNSQFVLSVTKGVMRFVSGSMPDEAYRIHTPVGTVGIRGTDIVVKCDEVALAAGGRGARCEIVNNVGILDYTCESDTVVVDQPGTSTTNEGEPGQSCTPPSDPAAVSAEATEAIADMATILALGLNPGAGPDTDSFSGTRGRDVTDVQNDAVQGLSNASQDERAGVTDDDQNASPNGASPN